MDISTLVFIVVGVLYLGAIFVILLGIRIAPRRRFEYDNIRRIYRCIDGKRFLYSDRRKVLPWFPPNHRIDVNYLRYSIKCEICLDVGKQFPKHADKIVKTIREELGKILSSIPEQPMYPDDERPESPEAFVTPKIRELSQSLASDGISFVDDEVEFRDGREAIVLMIKA